VQNLFVNIFQKFPLPSDERSIVISVFIIIIFLLSQLFCSFVIGRGGFIFHNLALFKRTYFCNLFIKHV